MSQSHVNLIPDCFLPAMHVVLLCPALLQALPPRHPLSCWAALLTWQHGAAWAMRGATGGRGNRGEERLTGWLQKEGVGQAAMT